ncbi:MAG: hypothetical protein HYZ08_01220 [Candidatus Kerfeldbacteria bacterium]|nr:hypothetical protein [Candidatus Kerfeldbacteria bacterium]
MIANPTRRLATRLGRILSIAVFALSIGLFASPQVVVAATGPKAPDAPTVTNPQWGEFVGETKPLFTGVTPHGTLVEIHVDGQFHGLARVADGGTASDTFAGRPSLQLTPGLHTAVFRAKDPDTGLRSSATKPITFKVEPQVAPALVKTVVDSRTTAEHPYVVGFSTNNTRVEIYVDGRYDGFVNVGTHPSNTVHFAYRIAGELDAKQHRITAVATSRDGRKSPQSTALTYTLVRETRTIDSPTTETESTDSDTSETTDEPETNTDVSVLGEQDDKPVGVTEETDVNANVDVTEDTTDEDASVTVENNDQDQEGEESDDGTNNTALVTWIIVIVVLVIILALRLRSGASEERDGTALGSSEGKDSSGNPPDNKNKGDKSPPPPPPSTSY